MLRSTMTSAVKVAKSLKCKTTLCDGVEMPLFGLGTFKMQEVGGMQAAEENVLAALKLGYRMLDTATLYANEEAVGNAVRKSGIPREEIFVVTKLWIDFHGTEKTRSAINESLKKLNIGYIDLYLIHSPTGGKILETYDEILRFQEKGLIKSVGVSNFGIHHMEGLKNAGRKTPSVNQIELHPWLPRKDLVDYCRNNDITVMGYAPLAKGKRLNDEQITQLASKYKKTNAQFLIRWSVQKGFITIPKSSSDKRVQENAEVFDFIISDEDMATLGKMAEMDTFSCNLAPYTPELFRKTTWSSIA